MRSQDAIRGVKSSAPERGWSAADDTFVGPGTDVVDDVAPHAASAQEVLRKYGVVADAGLDDSRAAQLLERVGPNELAEEPPPPVWRRFLRQFKDALVWILIAAALTSGVLREWVDAVAIVTIVLLNAAIGFFQEERASRAIAALRSLAGPTARVTRNGLVRLISSRELVPGDVVELDAGDRVPADARLIRSVTLRVQEAALTGESEPADKNADAELPRAATVGERTNMVHMGTVVAGGRASAVVTATGMCTEVGRIAGMLRRDGHEPTPLQRRLAELGRVLILICLAVVAVVFALELYRGGRFLDVFLLSVTLAVAAVPEGLPAVVTIALALGLQRMVKRNALVRRLPSVETLGCVTVICSDKTGTLTRNEMTVRAVVTSSGRFRVGGVGYVPSGEFFADGGRGGEDGEGEPVPTSTMPDLMTALEVGARCNRARLLRGRDGGAWEVVGDPTEGALLVVAAKAGIDVDAGRREVVHEIPFDSDRKAMSVVVRGDGGDLTMFTKGAPEVILALSTWEQRHGAVAAMTDERRREILRDAGALAADALRVLGLAYRRHPNDNMGPYPEADLVFAGLVGMIDPPRAEAKAAVGRCREAGIRPVMITGDHPATALAIARELGIAVGGGLSGGDDVVTGRDLDRMSDGELSTRLERASVFARVSPEHKLRVVRAWRGRGEVVAMTGDGVNDAPAVKAADIGIAMGATGTDVTREASDMVLLDDNFATIINAVEEGRGIYDNIQKVLSYLLACNLGEILLLLGAGLAGWPIPLTPPQVLWINLVTDGIPALALAIEPPARDVMRRLPRPAGESILTRAALTTIVFRGLLCAAAGLGAFAIGLGDMRADAAAPRSMAFFTIVLAELLLALASRGRGPTIARSSFYRGPVFLAVVVSLALQAVVSALPVTRAAFAVANHSLWQWGVIIVSSTLPMAIVELGKAIRQPVNPVSASPGTAIYRP